MTNEVSIPVQPASEDIQLHDRCSTCGHNRLEHATRMFGPGCPCGCKGFTEASPVQPEEGK